MNYLKFFIGQNSQRQDNSHIVLTTHNPLAIAELVKEQVQILYRETGSRTVHASNPAVDPKGMGFASIVTSDMFGLGTSLDQSTNKELLELHNHPKSVAFVKQANIAENQQINNGKPETPTDARAEKPKNHQKCLEKVAFGFN